MPSDARYVSKMETTSEIEQILQRIRVILGTNKGDVLGDFGFGCDIKKYIFSMDVNVDEIQDYIQLQILKYANIDTSKYDIAIKVSYGQDHYNKNDYALIDIYINQEKYMGIVIN
jgi:hypothetical protein